MRLADVGMTHDVTITVLVDNRADLIATSTETVKYYTEKPLLAEHGFAALIDLRSEHQRILLDAGIGRHTLLDNAKLMGVDLTSIDKIVLSHGHGDHTGAVTELLRVMDLQAKSKKWSKDASMSEIEAWARGRRIPLIVHPEAFHERWRLNDDSTRSGPQMPAPRAEWEALGAELVLAAGPTQLAPGCWATGAIPRLAFEQANIPAGWLRRQGGTFVHDDVAEDQAIFINVEGKGLVVISGCAHSGIVSSIKYAQEISGVDRVWAVLGGFHLATVKEAALQRTVDEIQTLNPVVVAPTHCTGFAAACRFATQMPSAFVQCLVGTSFVF
jgi:7,8-dihydropterin-6-yl-methyl-4-(beta-D-ribofuranosyl)aminobenzene 5'-phosphate synthase